MGGYYRSPITPGETWFQSSGGSAPAAGGFLLTYLAGTLTPQTTYTDASSGVANPVPTGLPFPNQGGIVLSATGMLPASSPDVWLSGGVAYRFILWDALGNVLADVDNIQGVNDPAFAAGSFGEWLSGPAATFVSSAAVTNGTVFKLVGDQRTLFQPNRRVIITSLSGALPGRIALSVFSGGFTNVTVDMDQTASGGYPTISNPITGLQYAVENTGGPYGFPHGIPSAAITLGFKRSPNDGSTRTGVDLYGSVGSNQFIFSQPVLTGGLVSVNGAGLFTWNATQAGQLRDGEAIQFSGGTAPGSLALNTTYIWRFASGTTGYFYAVPLGWIFEATPFLPPLGGASGVGTGGNDGGGGNILWGAPIAGATGLGAGWTCSQGWVCPPGITRIYQSVTGSGGSGSGTAQNQVNGAHGGGGGGTALGWAAVVPGTFYPASVGAGGAGATAGNNPGNTGGDSTFNGFTGRGGGGAQAAGDGSNSGAGNTASGGTINLTGSDGSLGQANGTAGKVMGGSGGAAIWGGAGAGGPANAGTTLGSTGAAGHAPGAGGGGAGSTTVAGGVGSNKGANGLVALQW